MFVILHPGEMDESMKEVYKRLPVSSNMTSYDDYLRVLFTGTYNNARVNSTWNLFSDTLRRDASLGDSMFFQIHRNESRNTLISKGNQEQWSVSFGEQTIHRKRIV